jgi:cyanate lyase
VKWGPEIFAQIEKMVAAEKIGRTEAFRRLAQKSGRQPGTVAAKLLSHRATQRREARAAARRIAVGAVDRRSA